MQKTTNKKNRRSAKWMLIAIIIIALALLLAYWGRFSLGKGSGDTGNTSSEQKTSGENATIEASNNTQIKITVKDESIYWKEEIISPDTLLSKLDELEKGKVTLQLIDDGATLGTYEEVEKALAASGHIFTKVDNIKK